MLGFSLAYLLAIIVVACSTRLLTKAKWRNILLAIPLLLIGLPAILLGILLAFKEPIQQGIILQSTGLGPLLNMIAPPADLYHPLAVIDLEAGKKEYSLVYTHKYLGNHALLVSLPKPANEEIPQDGDLSVTFSVSGGKKELFSMEPSRPREFVGVHEYGALLAWYTVPGDLPVSEEITATATISGNLQGFLSHRGGAVLKIQKISDE
jgi:hypothetical protein